MTEPSAHPAAHSAGYMAWALGLNYAAMISLAVAVNLAPVLLTTLRRDLGGLTNEQLGRIGAVTFAGLVSAILLTGPLADRLGAKPFAVLGNLLIAAGLGVMGGAGSYGAVLTAGFVMGFGAGTLDMVLSPIVCALAPEHKTVAMNWLHSFYCVGAVATVLVSSEMLARGVAWRTLSLWLIAMPALVGAGFIALRIPPLVQRGRARTRVRELCRNTWFLVALGAIFLAGATELGMAQWLPAHAENSLGYSRYVGGMALLAFSLAMAFGRMAAGVIARRVSATTMMLWCCAGSVVFFLVGCFAPWRPAALAGCIAAGLAGSCLWPSMLGAAASRFPSGGASMFGLLAAMGNLGGIFMPWVVGAVADRSSLSWGLSTGALCPLAMIGALVWLRRRTPERAP